jgi:hypothetical protein
MVNDREWLVGGTLMHQTPAYWTLRQCRTDLYDTCDRRAAALLDLVAALLTAGPVSAPVQLSLAPRTGAAGAACMRR